MSAVTPHNTVERPGAHFTKLPIINGPVKVFCFPFKRFENCTVTLSAKSTNWTSFEVRTHPTILENLTSKYDIGPVIKVPGLSRGPFLERPGARFSKLPGVSKLLKIVQ